MLRDRIPSHSRLLIIHRWFLRHGLGSERSLVFCYGCLSNRRRILGMRGFQWRTLLI